MAMTDGMEMTESGGGFMWVFFLFFLLAWGGGGFGMGGRDASAVADLTNQNVVRDIYNGFAQLSQSQAQCCCSTQREIDNVKFDLSTQACANTQAILDKLNQQEIQGLRDKAAAYELQLSNQAQSAALIAALRPTPIPAYVTCSPYTTGTGCY